MFKELLNQWGPWGLMIMGIAAPVAVLLRTKKPDRDGLRMNRFWMLLGIGVVISLFALIAIQGS